MYSRNNLWKRTIVPRARPLFKLAQEVEVGNLEGVLDELACVVRVDKVRHCRVIRMSAREDCKSTHARALVKVNELKWIVRQTRAVVGETDKHGVGTRLTTLPTWLAFCMASEATALFVARTPCSFTSRWAASCLMSRSFSSLGSVALRCSYSLPERSLATSWRPLASPSKPSASKKIHSMLMSY